MSNTPRNEKKYIEKCTKHEIVDEFHYILNCLSLQQERNQYLPASYIPKQKILLVLNIMFNSKHFLKRKLCSFIKKINKIQCMLH